MPITIKPNSVKYKDPVTGTYVSVDVMGEKITHDAEAYAKGTKNGVPVTSLEPGYHDNSKYYAEQAQNIYNSIPQDYSSLASDVDDLKDDLDTLNEGGLILKDDVIAKDIQDWLDAHPEATTTVQDNSLTTAKYIDGSITETKLADALKLKTIKDYVTPEMFGAKGDGIVNDTFALNECFKYPNIKLTSGKTYKVDYINVDSDSTFIDGCGATILFNSDKTGKTIGDVSNIYKTECLSNRNRKTDNFDMFVMQNVNFNGGGATFINYSDYNSTYTALLLIQLFNYKTVKIESCIFYDTIQDAVYLSECENVSIKHCVFDTVALNSRLTGTRNAITARSQSKTSVIDVCSNSFTNVYDECMRLDDYSVANITNNTAYHCYQYFAELFFNHVSGYSCDFNFTGNTINELADSFINVSSAISTTLQLNIEDNIIKGLGSANISDNDHSVVYYCSILQRPGAESGDIRLQSAAG